ncbi:ammonium transporter AmtB-like domain-containing protein [Phlyctochytrium arcticum]|nr:ammonium transporter AmtB-like domain-containing protein [Phlyctochytrium arcticum]
MSLVTVKDINGQDVQIIGTAILDTATNSDPNHPFTEIGYASTGFLILCVALVFFMGPGLGFFYSGMTRSKNALSLIMVIMLSVAVISIQWMLFGFSLAFSESGGSFMGNFKHAGLTNIGAAALPMTAAMVPGALFVLYQMQFATITAAIIFGSVAERIRLVPAMIFILVWSTLVYDPAVYWTWSARGWIKSMSCLDTITSDAPCGIGGLDFAGGGPVHIASGFAGLAYCLILGKRRKAHASEEFKAHNMTNVFLGTGILWFGWFGFNGGSAIGATPRAAMASLVTTIAASSGALAWVAWDFFKHRKLSGLGFCSGVVAGLVGITPAAGYVAPWAAVIIGAVTAVACNMAVQLKMRLGFDDSLDAWGVHGVGGLVGDLLTGVFAQKWIAGLDGGAIDGGWIDGNFKQVGYQLAGSVTIAAYSFTLSCLILIIINKIPGLHLRPSETDELLGNDLGEMGEVAYEIVASFPTSHSTLQIHEKVTLPSKESQVDINEPPKPRRDASMPTVYSSTTPE